MRILLLLLFFALFFPYMINAQEIVGGEQMTAVKRSVMTMKQMIDFEKSHPSIKNIKHKIPNEAYGEGEQENEVPPVYDIPKGAHILYDSTSYLYRSPSQMTATPAPSNNFTAIDDDNWIPPDVNGAVGPNHIMTTLNGQYRIQNRTGGLISSVTMLSFWNGFGLNDVFDPKILYDPFNGRWINVGIAQRSSAASSILVAVSATNDPTGTWYRYVIDATSTDTMWADYPSVGYNKNWIVVTANMFGNIGGSFQTGQQFVLNKANFYSGGSGQFTKILGGGNTFTLCPAIAFDTTTSTEYMVQTWNGNSAGNGYIRSYTITGSIGSEVLTAGPLISSSTWGSYIGNNFAPQSGTSNLIDCDDDRMMQVVLRNNSLWAVHHIFLPTNAPNRCSVQCWQLTTAGVVTQHFFIDDATGTNFYAYPSIAVNYFNDVLIGCSRFSSSTFPSSCYSLRLHTDAINTIQSPFVYKSGLASYNKTFGGSRNRWGDYTSTCVDPLNDNDFWTIQEYTLTPSGGTDRWGTWWANVAIQNTPVADFSTTSTTACVNSNIIFTNNTVGTATSYSWNFGSGASPATSTSAGPVTVQYSTTGLKTITLTSTGPGGSNAKTRTNYINVQSITPSVSISANPAGVICSGTSVTFTATPVNGGTTPSFQWKVNGTNSGINSATFTTTSLTNGQIITCILTSNASCLTQSTATSTGITLVINPLPSITGQLILCAGSFLQLTGSPTASVLNPWTSGNLNAATVSSTGMVTGISSGTSVITYKNNNNCSVNANMSVLNCGLTLNLKCFFEGYYIGNGMMVAAIDPVNSPSLCDTVRVELHNPTSPYNLINTSTGVLNINGTRSFLFPSNLIGQSFYIAVKHRNAIETWSASPVTMSAVTSYDFTTARSQAYGNNQVKTSDNISWAFYSGDIGDANTTTLGVQDGVIESVDYSYLESAVNIILTGYVVQDLTGDGVVESSDYSIVETNLESIIFSMHP